LRVGRRVGDALVGAGETRAYNRSVLENLLAAAALVFSVTFVHAGCTVIVLRWNGLLSPSHWSMRSALRRASVLAALILMMSIAAYLEAAIWACFYWASGALPAFADAMYFSLVTFTTLGYGDVVLGDEWRILAAFESANGIIMFGWTTALIVNIGHHVFRSRSAEARAE
jgi:hypothetical protein